MKRLARNVVKAAGNTIGLFLIVYAGWLVYVPLGCALAGLAAILVAWLADGKDGT